MSEFTPGELSKITGIPSSTVRRYVILFGDYLSPGAKRLRSRSYTETDLAIISRIRDLSGQGVPLELIGEQLKDVIPQAAPPEELPPQTQLAIIQRITHHVEDLSGQVKDQNDQLQELRSRVDALAAALETERSKPWYKRLFGRKDKPD